MKSYRRLLNLSKQSTIVNHSIKISNILNMYSAAKTEEHPKEVRVIDMRSDTLTKPTPLMRKAMLEAEVGDDVYGEDPTVIALEEKAALLLEKEAAIFIPSGTMGNLIATLVHCNRRGCEIIVGDSTHMFKYEQGGAAQIAGVQICTLPNKPDGTFDLQQMEDHVRGDDDHEPTTALICVENTHNFCGGKVLPLKWLDELAQKACSLHLPLHMDGARLFNAAIQLNVPASRIVRDFASVTFCLSKGLGAPVGSVLVGDRQFIKKARRSRKVLGGGMRQAGVIAAAGIVALDHMLTRLAEDHTRAATIAKCIADFGSKCISVDLENLHTNILMINTDPNQVSAQEFCKRLITVTEDESAKLENGTIVKIAPKNSTCARLVTHEGISDKDVQDTVCKLKFVMTEYESL